MHSTCCAPTPVYASCSRPASPRPRATIYRRSGEAMYVMETVSGVTDTRRPGVSLPITFLRGGRIYAPGSHGPSSAAPSAMIVRGAVIELVGSDDEATAFLERMGVTPDETIRLGGALVTPGFVDAHVHTTST